MIDSIDGLAFLRILQQFITFLDWLCIHCLDARLIEPSKRQHRDVGQAGPRRLELLPEGEDRQDRQVANALDCQIKQLDRGGIGPLKSSKRNRIGC